MSWYNSLWLRRIPILVDGAAVTGAQEVAVPIPTTLQHFWDNVQSAGEDIRITTSDGVTLVSSYDASTFNTTTQVGTLEIKTYTLEKDNAFNLLWLYFDNAAASTDLTTTTPGAPINGYISDEHPVRAFTVGPQRLGDTNAREQIPHHTTDIQFVYFKLELELAGRCGADYQGSPLFEEVQYAIWDVLASGTPQAGQVDDTLARFIQCDGDLYFRGVVKAGSDATNYMGQLEVGTDFGRVFVRNLGIQTNDVVENT